MTTTALAPASAPAVPRPPSLIRTLGLTLVNFAIWAEINIRRGSYAALIASGWLIGTPAEVLWLIAIAGSATQWYITREWDNPLSLFTRSRFFRYNSALILFIWDIAFPAWGFLASANKLEPWSWINFTIAVIIQIVCSWYCQQNWTDAAGDLWKIARGGYHSDPNDLPDSDQDEVQE